MKQFTICLPIIVLMAMFPINVQTRDLLSEWRMLDFDESMRLAEYPKTFQITKKVTELPGQQLYDFFKNLYVEQCASLPEIGNNPRIPKIIHIIWLEALCHNGFKP